MIPRGLHRQTQLNAPYWLPLARAALPSPACHVYKVSTWCKHIAPPTSTSAFSPSEEITIMSSSPVQASNGSPPLSSSLRARPFQCIFVFSYPRTMSNLFLRFFAQPPQVGVIDYPFDAAYMAGPERQSRRSNPQIDALIKARKAADHCVTYQMAYNTMQTQRRKIEAKVTMAKRDTLPRGSTG